MLLDSSFVRMTKAPEKKAIREPEGLEWEMSIKQYVDVGYLRNLADVRDEIHEQVLRKCDELARKKIDFFVMQERWRAEIAALEDERTQLHKKQLMADMAAFKMAYKSIKLRKEFGMRAMASHKNGGKV